MTRRGAAGFTLVEVLVALVIMAMLAALAWRGVDGMLRARDSTQTSLNATTRVATVMTQWEQDLQAVFDSRGVVPAITFDGNTLRLSRAAEGGVQMVAWSLYEGRWQRWASRAVTRSSELQDHWLRAQQLQGNEPEQLRLLEGVETWQVYFYRDGRLTNAQSTGDVVAAEPAPPAAAPATGGTTPPAASPAPAPAREKLPEGVQLVLRINAQTLKRDIALVPQT